MPSSKISLSSLTGWLAYLEAQHPKLIEMGLERVNKVKRDIGLSPPFPLIVVGGTNGKGSVCRMLESILSCAGYKVGCYTSPHLLKFNERIRIQQKEADDEALCQAFD
ncbi:MAG: bifunctional folylpolyglutamate synthase/dihydrofolate synthase, partial [Pseudomonadota bacterium]